MKISLSILVLAEILAMSLWFVASAIIPEFRAQATLTAFQEGMLSSSVQLGFVVGALSLAMHGTADRYDPRYVFALGALLAAIANAILIISPIGSAVQIFLRFFTGVCMASIYPVGMKIAVGWTEKQRGLVVGILVGALTLGSALPHGITLIGGMAWEHVVLIASGCALLSSGLILMVRLGPYHEKAQKFHVGFLALAWRQMDIRLAYIGYLGHMWELYAFWAWIGLAMTTALNYAFLPHAEDLARFFTFLAIALGAISCILAGFLADKWGKEVVAGWSLLLSGTFALITAITFASMPLLSVFFAVIWGIFVIPDSAQFSALVADAAPRQATGSLLTLQTALGFLLTSFTVQVTPMFADLWGWPAVLSLLALGPMIGVWAMHKLHLRHKQQMTH